MPVPSSRLCLCLFPPLVEALLFPGPSILPPCPPPTLSSHACFPQDHGTCPVPCACLHLCASSGRGVYFLAPGGKSVNTSISITEGFEAGMRTVATWLQTLKKEHGVTPFWRGYSPIHFV